LTARKRDPAAARSAQADCQAEAVIEQFAKFSSIGRVLHYTHNDYFVPFALTSLSYLVALGLMQALVPNVEPMEQD
jgi:hypothetical protein